MGQKVIIRFSGLSSASRKHLTTFCKPLVHYAFLRFVFRVVHYTPNNYRLHSACADGIRYITNFFSMIEQLHEPKVAIVNIEAFRNLIMFQQRKRKTKSLLDFYTQQKSESFLAYFMRILNSCVVYQNSILQSGVCANQSSRTPMLNCLYLTRH